jgi:hypothetical protein
MLAAQNSPKTYENLDHLQLTSSILYIQTHLVPQNSAIIKGTSCEVGLTEFNTQLCYFLAGGLGCDIISEMFRTTDGSINVRYHYDNYCGRLVHIC